MTAGDRLRSYRTKRDFKRTKEPSGRVKPGRKRGGLGYLIQKHDATAMHYDFRLEHDGILLSWAIPRGPSYDPSDKRLAVHVEDHPVAYGDFEGTIPKGEYGGGTVMLWDRGTWTPLVDVDEGLADGNLKFELHGERLIGRWALIRLRSRGKQDRGRDNWLLIKEKDAYARHGGEAVVDAEMTSVVSGRTMEKIALGDDVWRSRDAKPPTGKTTGAPKLTGARKVPSFVEPQLATLVDRPPPGNDWVHEIKYDGYRALASIGEGTVIIRTRKGLDWTDKFRTLVGPLSRLPCSSALLDGEIAVVDSQDRSDFGALQNALSLGRGGFRYYLFDLLQLDGEDLRSQPLRKRKDKLARLLAKVPKTGPLFLSEHLDGGGDRVFREAQKLKLEGIISKRASDPYRSGRTQSWLKSKLGMEQEFVIIGWRPSQKASRAFSSLLLAVREEGEMRYCGRVGSGYSGARLDDLSALFTKYARRTPPVRDIPREIAREARFLEPVLVAEIAFRGWTHDGVIRQGSFKGLRSDKPAREIIREQPMPVSKAARSKVARGKPAAPQGKITRAPVRAGGMVEGVKVTHPDRVLFSEQKITKRALIDYYLAVADVMLPHVAGRPLALVRAPRGSEGERFFQKHASPGWPEEFKSIRIKEKSGSDNYLYIEDERGLVAAAQMSVLELHIWGSRVEDVERPDRMVFDLDPDEGLPFGEVKDAARELKDRLGRVGLESFPMLTGGKGIHVVVPLARKHSWDEHRAFSEALARVMAEDSPERYVANMSKAKRNGKIFVDYLRNQRGSTAIAPYSTRARAGAFVAFPVTWKSLGRYSDAHPKSAADIGKIADPWPDYQALRQKLPLSGR